MKVELIIPIERLRGKLKQDGYYFRQYRGQQIVQRCPTKWKDTPAQIAAKARFAKVVAAVRTILADPTEKAKLKAEFKAQTKIGSLFGYAMHKLNANYDENGDPING